MLKAVCWIDEIIDDEQVVFVWVFLGPAMDMRMPGDMPRDPLSWGIPICS